MNPPVRAAMLVSGRGATLANFIQVRDRHELRVELALVISSKKSAFALEHARQAHIPQLVIPTAGQTAAQYSPAIFEQCRTADIQLVILAGYLHFLEIPNDFLGRVMNIHPSLLPAFGGPGFYGQHVHEAALQRGVKVSGCTVHFADHLYDHGPIILQTVVPVLESDTAVTLAERVFVAECETYPNAINLFADNRLRIVDQRVQILPS